MDASGLIKNIDCDIIITVNEKKNCNLERGMYMLYCVETQADGFVGMCKDGGYKEFFKNYFTRPRVEDYLSRNGYSVADLYMLNNIDYEILKERLANEEIERYENKRKEIKAGRCAGSDFYSGKFHFYFDYE